MEEVVAYSIAIRVSLSTSSCVATRLARYAAARAWCADVTPIPKWGYSSSSTLSGSISSCSVGSESFLTASCRRISLTTSLYIRFTSSELSYCSHFVVRCCSAAQIRGFPIVTCRGHPNTEVWLIIILYSDWQHEFL